MNLNIFKSINQFYFEKMPVVNMWILRGMCGTDRGKSEEMRVPEINLPDGTVSHPTRYD